jgi:hypothetical protein
MSVPQNSRPPAADIIDQFSIIDRSDARTLGTIDKKRLSAHATKGAHRRVDATGDSLLCAGEKFNGAAAHL